jgi:hypothetical protein
MSARHFSDIIGKVATYVGTAHHYLQGRSVVAMYVVKQAYGDPDKCIVCDTNAELTAAGGLEPDRDIIEVVSWLGHPYHRWGAIPSDVKLGDLHELRETR